LLRRIPQSHGSLGYAITDVKKEIYWKLEAPFLLDYLGFGIDLRDYNALQVSESASLQNYLGQKLAFMSVFGHMMAGFEDTAALLLALKRRYGRDPECQYQKEFNVAETPVFYTMVTYRDFHLETLVPVNLSEPGFLQPEVVRRGLLNMAKFLCEDCRTNQTKNNQKAAIPQGGHACPTYVA